MLDGGVCIGTYSELGCAADALRRKVFVEEQGVPEDEIFDGMSGQAIHAVLFDGGQPTATVRLMQNGASWRIGLVAVEKASRGRRLGANIMRAAMDYIAAKGGEEIVLTAQLPVKAFYERLGFCQCGEAVVYESGFVLVPMKCSI